MSNVGYQTSVRKANTSLILRYLRIDSPMSRADLSLKTGLNRSTISSIISELLDENLIKELEIQPDGVGRPGIMLEINPKGGFAIGIEMGLDFVLIILTDLGANVLERRKITFESGLSQEGFLQGVETAIDEMLAWALRYDRKPCGIGLALPGTVNVHTGELIYAFRLNWRNINFAEKWQRRFGLPIFIENDANAAAVGEYYFGVARNVKNLIYIYLNGVGLGSGIFIGGRLLRGANGFAGEIGHVIIDPNGELCTCSRRGCWETLVGPQAILDTYRKKINGETSEILRKLGVNNFSNLTFDHIVRAARTGDSTAHEVLTYVGDTLGIGIGNLIRVLNPEMVVLGGDLSLASDLVTPVVKDKIWKEVFEHPRQVLQIETSHFGTDAAALGAASLILNQVLKQPNMEDI